MLEDIVFLFDKNFRRANSLIELYLSLPKKGYSVYARSDLLRVTIVMLHSTLEDFLRNLLNWKLPEVANKDLLSKIPINANNQFDNRKTKFGLDELVDYKGKTIDEIISVSIKNHLDTISFNSVEDIVSNLKKINIRPSVQMENYFPLISEMIDRRHNIVHQADRELIPGKISRIKSINYKTVLKYKNTVDKMVNEIVNQIVNQI